MFFLPKLSLRHFPNGGYYYNLFLVSPLPFVDIVIEITYNSHLKFGGVFNCSLYYMIFMPPNKYNLFYSE